MSVEQQLSNAVQACNNLAAAVNNKVGQIDQKVSAAEQKFDSFVDTADERYKTHLSQKFRVGGEWGTFYPVRIALRGGPVNKLNIYRANTVENKGQINGYNPAANPGTFTASLFGIGDSWGHRTPFYAFDSYHQQSNRFLGKVLLNYRTPSIWVWLRGGGVDYYLSHESIAIDVNDIEYFVDVSSDVSGPVGIYLAGCLQPDYVIDYQPILEADIDAGLPASGYIRGVS